MNRIDEIYDEVAARVNRRPKFMRKLWDVGDEAWKKIREYEKTIPPDQFDLELLRSRHWGSCSVGEASHVIQRVVLRLVARAGL